MSLNIPEANEIKAFRKLKFIKIQSIKIYLKLEKIVKMFVKII